MKSLRFDFVLEERTKSCRWDISQLKMSTMLSKAWAIVAHSESVNFLDFSGNASEASAMAY